MAGSLSWRTQAAFGSSAYAHPGLSGGEVGPVLRSPRRGEGRTLSHRDPKVVGNRPAAIVFIGDPLVGSPRLRRGDSAPDRWSWVHLAGGLGLGLVGSPWWLAVGLIVGFEAVEAALRRITTAEGGLFEYESWPNVAADVVIGITGYAVSRFGVDAFRG